MKGKIIMGCIIVALFCALLYTNDKAKRVATQLESTQIESRYWKDARGRSNAEVGVLLKDNFRLGKLADSLKKLDIKPRTVQKIITISTHSTDTITILKSRPFGNKWASFRIDNDELAYSFTDSLALITHTKRVGLFRRAYVTRAVSFNPYTKLVGVTSTEILPKTRRLSIGMHGGYGLQFRSGGAVSHGWNFGVGVNFRIF